MIRVLIAFMALAAAAGAQPPTPPLPSSPPPAEPVEQGWTGVKLDELPPQVRLGVRAEGVRRAWPVLPVVVVVPDEASYVEALRGWTLKARYPVLIEDGTAAAREDIARFIRGFQPERVVRWSAPDAPPPADGAERRERVEQAQRHVWREVTGGQPVAGSLQLVQTWKQAGVPSPGVVVADAEDPAWTAAAALAIGRAQPLVWVSSQNTVNGAMPYERFEALASEIEAACERTGLSWKDLGDEIDAVALCLNAPVKVQMEAGAVVATTDLLGRRAAEDQPVRSRERGVRWAWSGQVFGSEAQASYRAMCALFLHPGSAWIFDSYPSTEPWNTYDGGAAAEVFRKGGLSVTLEDSPRQGERQWRLGTSVGLDAGIVLVNTKGMADDFDLEPGKCRPGDVPFLRVPAMVHFVHSWSAACPAERATVAGRWLERGAYAYAGAVQEPFLQAFVPTPQVAARLLMPCAWAPAVRMEGGPAWKIAVIGDPLITVGPAPPRASIPLPLADASDVEGQAREALAERNFEGAIRDFAMIGRDADAARLAAALLREDPGSVTPALAEAAIMPLARTRELLPLIGVFETLPPPLAASGVLQDALWHACYPELWGTTDKAILSALRANMRADQLARDAGDLAAAMTRVYGRDATFTMLVDAKSRSKHAADTARVDEAIQRLHMRREP